MSIVGGAPGHVTGPASLALADTDPPTHDDYGMTIIASGGSGGAVRDFGVFNDGPSYTVYLDVSKIGLQGNRWSLQYGATRDARLTHPGAVLTPPYPVSQTLPHLLPALVSANLGRTIVVQATLTPDGALASMHILQSPDARLNEALLDCLSHWTFDAATMGADKVPVKVLLGIPIASAMSFAGDLTHQAN